MNKIVLLVSQDNKTVSQISRWLKELPEDVALHTANTIDELNSKFLSSTGEDAEPIVGENLRLLIFDVAVFGATDPIATIVETKTQLRKKLSASLKIMILSFDHSALPVRTFINRDVDDLLMKPLDHQLFMQKAGMLIADESATDGNFLFKQKANFIVEMAKEARIVKMSEFGLTVSNPSALAPGVIARLHSTLFGEKAKSSVLARVFSTRRDPNNPGHYHCYFTFFGIQPDQLMCYRRALRDRRKELRLYSTGYDPGRVPAAIRHVAVVDRNSTNASLVAESLTTNFVNLKTYVYSSYAQFLKAIKGSAVTSAPESDSASEPQTPPFNGSQITFLVAADNGDLIRTESVPKPDDHFCGIPFSELTSSPGNWLQLLLPGDRDEWDEFLLTLQRGNKAQATLYFKNSDSQMHALLIRGESYKGDNQGQRTLRLDIRALSADEVEIEKERRKREQVVFPQVDAIYVDATSIRDFPAWYTNMKDLLKKSNLLIGDKFSVCLMAEEKSELMPDQFRDPNVGDFMYKPVDRRFLTAKAAVLISDLVAANDNVDLSFTPANLPIKISKEVSLSEVAEFGFQIQSHIPLREGIFLRFFSPLFLDESGEGVLARCTSCEPTSEDNSSFGCFFTFFGVSDAQLKHIRNWIREDYVSKKDEAAG